MIDVFIDGGHHDRVTVLLAFVVLFRRVRLPLVLASELPEIDPFWPVVK